MDEYSFGAKTYNEGWKEEEFERLYSAPVEIVVLLAVFYGSISLLAVIGNTLVIWVVATARQMRTVTNLYIANLALADVIIGVFCIPFQFQAALLQRWNLPWFMCGFCPFVQALSVNVSVFTLTAIAVDRHRAIINPLRARPSKFASKVIIVGIWVLAFSFAIPCAIAFRVELINERYRENDIIYNVTRPFCMNKNLSEDQLQLYRYCLVFVQYLVPFCVISFVYIQMSMKLWGTRTPGNAQDSRDLALLRNKKKVIKMLIIVVIVFGLCWLPLQLYNILYVTIPEINEYHFINIVWFCCDWLAMSNSCYNPFIYGIYNEKFKREFNKRFANCFCKFHTNQEMPERTTSIQTRASSVRSIRSAYANSSMRVRGGTGSIRCSLRSQSFYRKEPTAAVLENLNSKNMNVNKSVLCNFIPYGNDTQSDYKSNDMALIVLTNGKTNQNQTKCNRTFLQNLRGNHLKSALQTDVLLEHDDDKGIAELAEPPILSISEHDSSIASDGIFRSESFRDNLSCVCEIERDSRTDCDGTCILNEVARVCTTGNNISLPTTTNGSTHNQKSSQNIANISFPSDNEEKKFHADNKNNVNTLMVYVSRCNQLENKTEFP